MPDIRRINEEWIDRALRKFRGEELFIGVIIPQDERHRSEITEILERQLEGYECIRRVDGITQTVIARFVGDNGNEIVVCQHDYYSTNLRLQRIANLVLCDELYNDLNRYTLGINTDRYAHTVRNVANATTTDWFIDYADDATLRTDEWAIPTQRDLTQTDLNRIIDTFNNVGIMNDTVNTYDFAAIHNFGDTHEPYYVFRIPDEEGAAEELKESEALDEYIKSLAEMKT